MDRGDADLTAALLAELRGLGPLTCTTCGRAICGHAYVVNAALGHKSAPHCASCLAALLGHQPVPFLRQVYDYVRSKDCYRTGWIWSSRNEGLTADGIPPCMQPAAGDAQPHAPRGEEEDRTRNGQEWDAGDMGCGDLVLELRLRMRGLRPGQILRLIARDPGAREDLPAWCRLTGHRLVAADHPFYLIGKE